MNQITTPAKDFLLGNNGRRDTSNDFVFGRDQNIILRWVDRLATAFMVYFLGCGIVIPIALVAWAYEFFWGTHEYNMVIYGVFFGLYHVAVGLLLMKYAVLPLHIRLAVADTPRPYYPLPKG